jgi:hypothetical protein
MAAGGLLVNRRRQAGAFALRVREDLVDTDVSNGDGH